MKKARPRLWALFESGIVAALSLLFVTIFMQLWNAEWRIPFYYSSGDAFASQAVFKSIIDNGTYLYNPKLGAPGQLEYHDFPRTDHVQVLIGQVLSWFSQDYALLINVFFVLTFPLTALIAFLVLRHFGISFASALMAGLLYSFIPFHFYRGQAHFFLNCYFLIPLSVTVMLWVGRGEPFLFRNLRRNLLPTPRGIFATIFCLLIASSGTYYTFFSCFLLMIAGLYALFETRRWRVFTAALFFIGILFFGAIANLIPVIRYWNQEGKNPDVASRSFTEAEAYALKLTGLLLPGNGHRFLPLNRMMRKYPSSMLKENHAAYLGVVGVTGFFILIVWLFFPAARIKNAPLCGNLATLNGSLVLLGLAGGGGPLFAFVLFSQFRAYNRVSIFLGFFALFAIALVLDRFRPPTENPGIRHRIMTILPFAILLLGLWDQTLPAYHAKKPKQIAEFRSDEEFVSKIESLVSAGSMIFQLPYHPFPESDAPHRMRDYDHLRGYLHTDRLRWSYGAMRGRKWDHWQKETASLPLNQFLQRLREAGFKGVYLDRNGYSRQNSIEDELQKYLGEHALESPDSRLIFFLL